jgi:hypothetical protein
MWIRSARRVVEVACQRTTQALRQAVHGMAPTGWRPVSRQMLSCGVREAPRVVPEPAGEAETLWLG